MTAKLPSLRGLSGDALLLTFIRLVTMTLSFAVTRLLSQQLTVYDYGTYSEILLIVSTVSSLTILGMGDGVNYFFCSEGDSGQREAYIATLYLVQCIISAVSGCLIMVCSAPIAAGLGNDQVKQYLAYAAVLPLLQNLLSMTQVLIVSVGKARLLALRNLAVSLIRLWVVLLMVAWTRSIGLLLLATVLLDAGQLLFFLCILRKNGSAFRLRKAQLRLLPRIMAYTLPMAVFTLLSIVNRDCDKYVIAAMTDTETLAVYANASKMLPFDIVLTSFSTVMLPALTRRIAEGKRGESLRLYRRFFEIVYGTTAVMVCAALVASPQLMELLYTEKYLSGYPIFAVYLAVDFVRVTNVTLVLSAAGKTKPLTLLAIGSAAANLGLDVLLFSCLGVIGPAVATLAVTGITGLLMMQLSAKELGGGTLDLVDAPFLVRFAAANVALSVLLLALRTRLEQAGVQGWLTLLLLCAAYGVTMCALYGKRLLQDLRDISSISQGRAVK
ncbi:MAG: oligosaccharide flippase family protein [Clostridiales bacterium]|nr:oligosaccharide flippase family protein [Clostridiales bacterium]